MNRPQRYEPVSQRDETIILDPIINYNTALPTSVASSSTSSVSNFPTNHTPNSTPNFYSPNSNHHSTVNAAPFSSQAGLGYPPSIPNSPPPSFHTHSSPGTPRPSLAQLSQSAELWGVAPSTVGGETVGSSADAVAVIAGLKQRVEWLEESIGRLLLEKERSASATGSCEDANKPRHRDNCCVTFSDAPADLERLIATSSGNNCCVLVRSKNSDHKRELQRNKLIVGLVIVLWFMVCLFATIVLTSSRGPRIGGSNTKI